MNEKKNACESNKDKKELKFGIRLFVSCVFLFTSQKARKLKEHSCLINKHLLKADQLDFVIVCYACILFRISLHWMVKAEVNGFLIRFYQFWASIMGIFEDLFDKAKSFFGEGSEEVQVQVTLLFKNTKF